MLMRTAIDADLPMIVAMLIDGPLGQSREDAAQPPAAAYVEAFAAIDADPNHGWPWR